MSKIGRKPILLGGVAVEVVGQEVFYKGPKASGSHILPIFLSCKVGEKSISLTVEKGETKRQERQMRMQWGLHRSLLNGKIEGANREFERTMQIKGIGYKAQVVGNKMTLKLGYSHDVVYNIEEGVSVLMDKSGQRGVFRSSNKEKLGSNFKKICKKREPNPYNGAGIQDEQKTIKLKPGKTKSSG